MDWLGGQGGAFWLAVVGLAFIVMQAVYRVVKRNDELNKMIFELQDKFFLLQQENHKCELERGIDREEIKHLMARCSHLERGTGLGQGDLAFGIVVADLQGIIREFSPTLAPLFHWLPAEVIGRPITMLMPPSKMKDHMSAFSLFVQEEHRDVDSNRIILTEALSKEGVMVPVQIQLRSWQQGTEGLISATIRERAREAPIKPQSIPDIKLVTPKPPEGKCP